MQNHSDALGRMFQALSDPTRRAMVERLARGDATVSELAKPLPVALPTVLMHLGVLEESGLVKTRKEGRVRTARLDRRAFSRAEKWFSARRAQWEDHLDRLVAMLDEEKTQE